MGDEAGPERKWDYEVLWLILAASDLTGDGNRVRPVAQCFRNPKWK